MTRGVNLIGSNTFTLSNVHCTVPVMGFPLILDVWKQDHVLIQL